MKYAHWIIAALMMVATACNSNKKSGTFTVKGKIQNLPSTQIVLDKLSMETGQPYTLDTAKVAADGTFSLQAPVDEESVYRLMINDNDAKQWIFLNDNKNIEVTLNGNDLFKSTSSGSKATQELYTFLDAFNVKDSLLMHDIVTLDSLEKKSKRTPAEDSLVITLTARREAKISDINNTITSFVSSANSPAAKYFVITALGARSIEPAQLAKLVNEAADKNKDHKQLAKLKEMVNAALKERSQQPAEGAAYALLNKQAPDLTMQSPDGKSLKISDFKGKYLLVDFWASWCGPCRAENPNVVAAYNQYKNKNFTILGVSLDKDKAAWVKAIEDDKLGWNHMSDLKFWESAAVPAYQFEGIPFNVLIDPSGKIIASGLRGADLGAKLAQLLK